MKTIKDIRIYRSNIENIDGNSLPAGFADKGLNATLYRITMKLREHDFKLGDFDHLYINMTTCPVKDQISVARRSVDRYSPWYRFYDVAVSGEQWESLTDTKSNDYVIAMVEQVLTKCFCANVQEAELVHACILEAVTNGEKMEMKYKEKQGAKNKAVIYLRYLDNTLFWPLLRVYDLEDHLLLEKDLPKDGRLDALGEIQLSAKKVTIKPRKNFFAEGFEPITFML